MPGAERDAKWAAPEPVSPLEHTVAQARAQLLELYQAIASPALRINAPGSRPASVSTWKPLQMPSTGTPLPAASITARITGERAAIAPERR